MIHTRVTERWESSVDRRIGLMVRLPQLNIIFILVYWLYLAQTATSRTIPPHGARTSSLSLKPHGKASRSRAQAQGESGPSHGGLLPQPLSTARRNSQLRNLRSVGHWYPRRIGRALHGTSTLEAKLAELAELNPSFRSAMNEQSME